MNPHVAGSFVALVVMGFSSAASAATPVLSGSGYPAPGGTTSAYLGGNTGTSGGLTRQYSGFDTSAYDQLYFALGDYSPGFDPTGPSIFADGTRDALTFNAGLSNLANGVAVWTGTTNVYDASNTPLAAGTRFQMTVTDGGGNPLPLIMASSTGLGFVAPLLQVTGTTFRANFQSFLQNPYTSTYGPALTTFDAIPFKSPAYQVNTSYGGGFYYTAPVPEPAEWAMMLSGLGLVGWIARRRRGATAPAAMAAA
jgi:hypothetical protein